MFQSQKIITRKEHGMSLVGMLVALAILGILAPFVYRYITHALEASKLQTMEADYELIRTTIRGKLDCQRTKDFLVGGVKQETLCAAYAAPTEVRIIGKDNQEMFAVGDQNNLKNWIGTYRVKATCDMASREFTFYALRVTANGSQSAAIHPLRKTPMEWKKLFEVPLCNF